MEKIRISGLDNCCEAIAEIREKVNALRADEDAQKTIAMRLMHKHERVSWQAAGVELLRVPGEEKLRVRTTKGGATTAEVGPENAAAGAPNAGGDDDTGPGDE